MGQCYETCLCQDKAVDECDAVPGSSEQQNYSSKAHSRAQTPFGDDPPHLIFDASQKKIDIVEEATIVAGDDSGSVTRMKSSFQDGLQLTDDFDNNKLKSSQVDKIWIPPESPANS